MISIIIPVFNKFSWTKFVINELSKLQVSPEIIIIDNASSDQTQQELSVIQRPHFHYIRNSQNEFHSKACNQGYAIAQTDYVCFLNNDVRVKNNHTNWTDILVQHCDDNIVGPSMGLLDKDFNFVKESNQQLMGNTYLAGWCLASHRKNWQKLADHNGNDQVFDETFSFYFNDTNLGFQAKQLGIPLKVIDLPIVHFGKVSASQFNIPKMYSEARQKFVAKWGKK